MPEGRASLRFLESLFEREATSSPETRKIPNPFWICTPLPGGKTVLSTGAVLLHFTDAKGAGEVIIPAADDAEDAEPTRVMVRAPTVAGTPTAPIRLSTLGAASRFSTVSGAPRNVGDVARMSMWAGPVLADEVKAELSAPTVRPARIFARMLWAESQVSVIVVTALVVISVVTGVLDAILMRGLASTVGSLSLPAQRVGAILAVALFLVFAFGLDLAQQALGQRLARGLEARLRVAFLEKLPRLEDRYFRSRPISDMASRAHLLQTLRNVPSFLTSFITGVLNILVTTGMLIWLEPRLKWLACGLLVLTLSLPVVSYRLLDERLARLRIHGAALSRFYLDALLGVLPIRVHGAERAVRREHEGLLTEWVRTSRSIETLGLAVLALEGYFSTFVAVALVVSFVARGGDLRALLLLALFAQRLPVFAEGLVRSVRAYPVFKHDALRLFEPLSAAEANLPPTRVVRRAGPVRGVSLAFRNVSAVAGGRDVLKDVSLEIPGGTHVAVVGASGAGKSSLVSVLLGWLFVSKGRLLIDGRPLDGTRLAQLRDETAWIDPSIQLWNQSLFENLTYGHGEDAFAKLEGALQSADLLDVVERLPDGLQSSLGEGGSRLSGGQGQRVRLGRAMLKRDARLVILDEPFRGLERDKRRLLLAEVRRLWPTATILYVSHDVHDTLEMDRVIVIDGGAVVEHGTPEELLAAPATYHSLVEADRNARADVWGRPEWRRVVFEGGVLREEKAAAE